MENTTTSDWGLIKLTVPCKTLSPGIYLCRAAWLIGFDEKEYEFRFITAKESTEILTGNGKCEDIWKRHEHDKD